MEICQRIAFYFYFLVYFLGQCWSQATTSPMRYIDPMASSNSISVNLGGLIPVRRNRGGSCGELIPPGVERAEGMVYAIRVVNTNSTLLPNVNLTFDIQDTCEVPNIALEHSIAFVQNSDIVCSSVSDNSAAVSGVVGAALSSVSAATANLLRLFQIPQISFASSAMLLSDSQTFDYFFRTVPSDVFQARAMADLIKHFNWTFIFALYSDDTYGREGISSLLDQLNNRNSSASCIALRVALPRGSIDMAVYDRIAQDMNQQWVSNASVAVLFGHPAEAKGIIDAILRQGATSSLRGMTWIASDSWAITLPREYHSFVRGMIGLVPDTGNVSDFRNYFDALRPNTTLNPWFNEYWESVFKCNLSEPSCLDESKNLSHVVVSPSITNIIDAVNAFAHALHQLIMDHCPNGNLCENITIARSVGRAVNGMLLRKYLRNVSIPSTFSSGSEQLFDSNGDVQGSYMIFNLQSTSVDNAFSFEPIGVWDHVKNLQFTDTVQWNDGGDEPPVSVCSLPCEPGYEPRQVPNQPSCCHTCEPCLGESSVSSGSNCFECEARMMPNSDRSGCVPIPVSYFTSSSPWAIVILCLTCIGLVVATFVGVMFVVFHRKKVIKASSRELSALILTGILLCYIIPFLFIVQPTPALCGVRRFVIGFCFAISYSALLVRSNRIHRIFNRPANQIATPPRFIGSVSQVVFSCLLISVQVIIAIIWLAVEVPSVQFQQLGPRTVELRCGESPYFGLSVSLIYSLFLLVVSTYFAFLARRVPDNFNEAKFINITLYSLCIIWIGFIPAYFISVQFGTIFETFFLLLGVFLSASVTLVCLLMPKIFIVLKNEKMASKTNSDVIATPTDISATVAANTSM